MSAAEKLIETTAAAFVSEGWNFHRVAGHEVLEAAFEMHHSKIMLHAQAFPEIRAVSVVATASLTVPPSHLHGAAELLMRTNEQLTVGNFELVWDNGQTLFRTTNIFSDGTPADPTVLVGMVNNALAETDRITPYLSTLIKESPAGYDVRSLLARGDLAWEAEP